MSEEPIREHSRVIQELERIFMQLNETLLFRQQNLPLPVITVQSCGRRVHTLGWFARKAWTDGDVRLPEINLSAEYLRRPVTDVVGTLVHEMVHESNWLAGVRDCSSTNYHNRQFKTAAERVHLICERADDGKNLMGWAYTTPSPKLCDIIHGLDIDEDAFALYRELPREFKLPGEAWEKSPKPAEPRMKKWSCGCTNIWSAVEVVARCSKPNCGGDFRRSVVFR